MIPSDRATQNPALDELVQALKARAGFDVLYPEGPRKEKIIEFVSRLVGPFPDAYDVLGAGVYLETMRVIGEKARQAIDALEVNGPESVPFEWSNVPRHVLLRGLEDLTVSMGKGKGRKEGVDISKTAPIQPQSSRWSWWGRQP